MRILLLISLLILLSSCSVFTKEIPVPVRLPIVCETRNIEKIDMLPVQWVLGRTENGDYVVGLDGENYTNLAINIGRTTEHMIERKEYSIYLERCIERFNNSK